MGNYFNNKLLHPKEDGNELEQRYFWELKEVDELFDKYNGVIIIKRDVVKKQDTKKQSYRAVVPFAIPNEIPIYLKEYGAVTVRYSKGTPIKKDKETIYPTFKNFIEEFRVLTRKENDLAWFLLKATTFVLGGDPGKKKIFHIFDPQKEVLSKASEVKRIAKVDALLINEESPIMDIKIMREIADKFGIDIKDYEAEAAGFMIREAVIDADKKNNPDVNIKAFMSFSEKLVNKALKNKPKVEEEEEVEVDDAPEEVVFYTKDILDNMHQKEISNVSRKLGTPYPPKCNREAQTEHILNAQAKVNV
jgi:hypothetical protein